MMAADNIAKHNSYVEKYIGDQRKYECLVCSRILTTKHSVLRHLHQQHSLSPLKAVKKLYRHMDRPIPRSTLYRWKSNQKTKMCTSSSADLDLFIDNDCDQHPQLSSLELHVPNILTNDQVNDESSLDGELSDTSVESFATTTSSEDKLESSDSENSLCDEKVSDSTDMKALKILSCFE